MKMVETEASGNVTGSVGEQTSTGIFGGAEKYLNKDGSDKNAGTNGDEIMRSGIPVLTKDVIEKGTSKVEKENAGSGKSNNPAVVPDDSLPLHLKELDKHLVDDGDFVAWLILNQDEHLPAYRSRANTSDSHPKKHHHHQKRCSDSSSSSSSSSSWSNIPDDTDGISASSSPSKKSENYAHHHHRRKSGIFKDLTHALHLDRHARKKEKEVKEHERAKVEEEIDMEKWGRKIKEKMMRKQQKKILEKSASKAAEASTAPVPISTCAPTDPRQRDAMPLSVLNPELLEKRRLEEEILNSGGDLSLLYQKNEPEGVVHVSSERIKELVEIEIRKRQSGIPDEDETSKECEEEFKVTFHTADSLEQLTDTDGNTPQVAHV